MPWSSFLPVPVTSIETVPSTLPVTSDTFWIPFSVTQFLPDFLVISFDVDIIVSRENCTCAFNQSPHFTEFAIAVIKFQTQTEFLKCL
jgi:hypothetical protein